MRKLVSAPDYMLGSVAAVTLDGALVVALGDFQRPRTVYAAAAGRVVLVVGSPEDRAGPRCRHAPHPRGRLPVGILEPSARQAGGRHATSRRSS